jgi:alpha-ketoglutarate-dependent taurine dioxygenase
LQPRTENPRAWHAGDVADPRTWYYPLPDRLTAGLDAAVAEWRRRPVPLTELRPGDGLYPEDLRPALDLLERGPGFVILSGVPRERYSAEEWKALYWLVGRLLGRPAEQNVQGTLLYDVRDTGQDVRSGVRFSVTNAESGFHTDNSFGDEVVDYVGLLCLKNARAGGVNQLVSAYAVHERLRARHPEALPVLYAPFHIDRRGGVRPGEPPTARFPILRRDGDELVCRYLRYWVEVGHEKAGEPLTPEQVRALDALDAVAREGELRVEFTLEPGQMLFVNNRWILHNRTGFEDHPEPERRRHLLRLWLRKGT